MKFKHNFVLGSGSVGAAGASGNVVFVKITTDCGTVGWGEQRALPSWSYETVETMAVVIEKYFAPLLTQLSPFDVELFHAQANSLLSPSVSNGFPFARAAVDIAMHDAAGKIAGVPVHALLGGKVVSELKLCSAIGVDSAEAMAARAVESGDYHAYKIKISGDVARDTRAIHAVADAVDGKPLWLDANQSYQPSGMLALLKNIADVPNLRCVEQPVASTNWAGMAACAPPWACPWPSTRAVSPPPTWPATLRWAPRTWWSSRSASPAASATRSRPPMWPAANGVEILASGLTDCGIAFAASLHLFSLMNLALPAELNGPGTPGGPVCAGAGDQQRRGHGSRRARAGRHGG